MSCGCCLRGLQRCKCLNPCVPSPRSLQPTSSSTQHWGHVTASLSWSPYPGIRAWSCCSGSGRAIPSIPYQLQCVCVWGFTQAAANQRLPAAQRLPIPPAPRNSVQRALIGTIRKAFPKAPLHTWACSDVGWDTLAFPRGFNLMLALTLGRISQVGENS